MREKKGHDSIFCDGSCQDWIHSQCAGLSKASFTHYSKSNDPFFCPKCTIKNQSDDIATLPKMYYKNQSDDIATLKEAVSRI